MDIGRNREKRNVALHDLANIRSRQLPPGAAAGGTSAKEAHQEKTVKPNTPLCGPVCGFGGWVEKTDTSETGSRPVEAVWGSCERVQQTETTQFRKQLSLSP